MPVIMGTAGHIDHGKTNLIKALSGIDCDRLKEEKKRGITIELGFAYVDLPGGQRLGIVDVPGHEKFVKNMVAGAAGIDFVLLVVAADEGVMPQTREHLEICSILGIKHGLVALTKVDMVEPDLMELAQEDVRDHLQGTFLEEAPIFPVSAHTGEGVDVLRQAVVSLCGSVQIVRETDLFRLPVDRVFSMRGHGTVITGTLVSGQIDVGDDVEVYPQLKTTHVRGLQVHGQEVQRALAGQRTACNLAGVEVSSLQRGDVLARPGTLIPSQMWDLELTCLSSAPRPLRHRTELHFHHGSREVLARIFLLDRDKLQPGDTALAQVRFTEPMAGVFGDRFVLRAYAPLRTIGGGRVLGPAATKIKRHSSGVEQLQALAESGERGVVAFQLARAGQSGLDMHRLRVMTGIPGKRLENHLQDLGSKQEALLFDREERAYVHGQVLEELKHRLHAYVQTYHTKHPMRTGVTRSELASGWGQGMPHKLLHFLLERAARDSLVIKEGETFRLPEHRVSLAADQEKFKTLLVQRYKEAGLRPPNLREVLEELDVTAKEAAPLLRMLVEGGELVKVKEELYFDPLAIKGLKDQVRSYFEANETLHPTDFKELTGLSRKYTIPLLEFLDREKVTMRVGDVRQLRQG